MAEENNSKKTWLDEEITKTEMDLKTLEQQYVQQNQVIQSLQVQIIEKKGRYNALKDMQKNLPKEA